MGEKKI